ncbi:MAG TPA: SGNH/GDSL hydrolase family protein [Candidatus Binatia bacterium]|jgi:outer membrane lipase/esterase|nr:SGNH/GDSL hydrolase family protein [Candidatus Binatia bacterium]
MPATPVNNSRGTYRVALRSVTFILFLFLAGSTLAASFNDLIVFGDSLSDHGNDLAITFGTAPKAPGYSDGRFSNGPLWVERLGTLLRLGAPTGSQNGGKDFAYGGVTTGNGSTILNPGGFVQIRAPNIGAQITMWTNANMASANQLFTLLGGGNDFFGVLDSGATTTAQSVADNMKNNVQTLYNDGARNVMVLNLPDLGKTPRYRGTAKAAQATQLTTDFNSALKLDLDAVQAADTGLNLFRLDLFTLSNDLIANPASYGLTNVTDRAYTGDDTFAGNGTAVADPSKYLFWDAVHPTSAAHTLIGDAAFALVPEPGSATLFLIFCRHLLRHAREPDMPAFHPSSPGKVCEKGSLVYCQTLTGKRAWLQEGVSFCVRFGREALV